MRIGLFVTCLGDTLFPEAPRAAVTVLERLGHDVVFPREQTCCGQLHQNSGYLDEAQALAHRFARIFGDFDAVVSPSSSCVGAVRELSPEIASRVFELSEFLVGQLGVEDVGAYFPHRVTYHPTCHSLRVVRVGAAPVRLLRAVRGLALGDTQLRHNLRNATTTIRDKRARVVAEVPDWDELREAGRAVKTEVMRRLDEYLLQFEESVQAAGGHVHWARDAAEANAIVLDVARAHEATEVVKVKSLTTDETGLNQALAAGGVHAIETDFAELILQLDGDWPSHILVPAIHRNRSEIRDLFMRTIADGRELSDDPRELADTARLYLRKKFLDAKVGVSGANFGIAETGTLV